MDMIEKVETIFNALNETLFGDSKIHQCDIVDRCDVLPTPVDNFVMAYMWRPKDCIMLNLQILEHKHLFDIVNITHHEMIHMYCHENKIYDVAYPGVHTKAFGDAAIKFGAKAKKIARYGYMDTWLTCDNMEKVLKRMHMYPLERKVCEGILDNWDN